MKTHDIIIGNQDNQAFFYIAKRPDNPSSVEPDQYVMLANLNVDALRTVAEAMGNAVNDAKSSRMTWCGKTIDVIVGSMSIDLHQEDRKITLPHDAFRDAFSQCKAVSFEMKTPI